MTEPTPSRVDRRRFLLGAGALGLGVGLGGCRPGSDPARAALGAAAVPATSLPAPSAPVAAADPSRRVLVLVQLLGGNDALNTVVPAAGRYHDARPGLGLDDTLVALAGRTDLGLHPSLAPLADRWAAGQLGVVAGLGLPEQSRSHFTAMDTWWSARPGEPPRTGWLGRWLDATADEPGAADAEMRAIALGGGAPALGAEGEPAVAVGQPAGFALGAGRVDIRPDTTDAYRATALGPTRDPRLAAARAAVPHALDAAELLASLASPPSDDDAEQPGPGGDAARLLDLAAGIVAGDLGTRVISVGVGGFDTHAAQADTHAALLADLATGLEGFLARVAGAGRLDDVLVVTTSEFGRRVAENGSAGTDHGTGGLSLVLGTGLRPRQVVGGYDLDRLVDGDLPLTVDTRSLYATALGWLGGPVDGVIEGPIDDLGLLASA
ncbi:MAG TPA: DUF1501 domain-containing protein [Acidimicrobiales bacterium]|nr:DUF1501 domain-containing protein [Acidimicrobiales bacterium]